MGMVAPGVVTDRLSWVTSSISNVGPDFDLWNGKLSGTIEWFNRKNEGILPTVHNLLLIHLVQVSRRKI